MEAQFFTQNWDERGRIGACAAKKQNKTLKRADNAHSANLYINAFIANHQKKSRHVWGTEQRNRTITASSYAESEVKETGRPETMVPCLPLDY